MPKASCSRSNHAPPMPSTARPFETWSSVVASLAVRPGLRKVLAPTMSPSRTFDVIGPSAESTIQPSKIGCSHGPKIASRWSHVQTEYQPRASARSAASRKPAQSVCCDQIWRPKRVTPSASVVEVVVERIGAEPEADPLLALEPVTDQALGLLRLMRVVAPG